MTLPSPNTAVSQQPGGQHPPTQRKTRVYLLVAVSLAVLTGLIVLLSGGAKGEWALVAKDNIGARTKLSEDQFEARQIPEDYLVGDALVGDSATDVVEKAKFDEGKYSQSAIGSGEQLTVSQLSGLKLSEPLKENERLMSISVDYADAAAGAVQVGDKVDVYGVGGSIGVSQLLIAGVEVVGVTVSSDQLNSAAQKQVSDAQDGKQSTVDELLPTDPIPGIYTIRIPNDVVSRIAIVDDEAKIMLVARGADATNGATQAWDITTALCTGPYLSTGEPTLPQSCAN